MYGKKLLYKLVSSEYSNNHEKRTGYGIEVSVISDDGRLEVIRTISDITQDRTRLQGLVDICNELSLSHLHIDDIVEDFLFD